MLLKQLLLAMISIIRIVFGLGLFGVILFSCEKNNNLDLKQFDKWEEDSFTELIKCCPEIKGSSTEFLVLSYFGDNLRYRVLNTIQIPKDIDSIEVIEEYYEGNNAFISIFLNKNNLTYTFIYYKDQDRLETYNPKEEIDLKKITKDNSDCCDLNGSHNFIFFYSKLKIKNNKIEVLDTYSY